MASRLVPPLGRLAFARDANTNTNCSAHSLLSCPQGLPSDFCCPQQTTCSSLAANTTAICCPSGSDCSLIQPIICDISKQDPASDLAAVIKTTALDQSLPKCGSGTCCPFGYSCESGDTCRQNANQDETPQQAAQEAASSSPSSSTSAPSSPSSSSSSSSSSLSSPSTSPLSASSTLTSAASTTSPNAASSNLAASSTSAFPDSSSSSSSSSSSAIKGPASVSIISGAVGGCLVLLLISLVIFLYMRRSNRRHHAAHADKAAARQKTAAGWSRVTPPAISDPIAQPNNFRTDFIRKLASGPASTAHLEPPRRRSGLARSLFTRMSIPDPFTSPDPSQTSSDRFSRSSAASNQDQPPPRTGRVAGARLKPIRAMKATSSRASCMPTPPKDPSTAVGGSSTWSRQPLRRPPSGEDIGIVADPHTAASSGTSTRNTTFTDLMDEADLGNVRRGGPYVPGTTPRI